jgi:aminoglycoside phosphotransferase
MTATISEALAADRALPQRDLLLDGEAMAARLSARLGARAAVPIRRCEPTRATYQPGRSLRVLYRVVTDRSSELVSLRTFRGPRAEQVYRQVAPGAVARGGLRGVARDPELGAVLFVFPNDRKVSGLGALSRDHRWSALATRLVSYAPEKCATARLVAPDGRTVAFAKAYAGDEGERTRRLHDAIGEPAARAGVRVPRSTDYSPARRTLVCEAIEGPPLAALAGAELTAGLRGLGAALAGLHGVDPPAEVPPFERVDAERLEGAAEIIGRLRPDCALAARVLLERLLEQRPPTAEPACLHGDVHLKNAIVANGRVALVDLDQIATGPPAADVGSMLAALRYARLVGAISAATERAHAEALLAGYDSVGGPLNPRALCWHLSAALLAERALRAITRLRAPGLLRLPALLEEARAALGGVGGGGP